jgi:hypothetical protein
VLTPKAYGGYQMTLNHAGIISKEFKSFLLRSIGLTTSS